MPTSSEAQDALRGAGVNDVSRETIERLEAYVALLREWSRVHNLIGPIEMDQIWSRHIADSAQLITLAPDTLRWIDFGSGAGLPGLILAVLLAERAGGSVELVEANATRAAFLREAGRRLAVPVFVHQERLERIVERWNSPVDALSARALAPMSKLVDWLSPLIARGVPGYFHKGLDFDNEWAEVHDRDRFVLLQHNSRIGSGTIVELRARRSD